MHIGKRENVIFGLILLAILCVLPFFISEYVQFLLIHTLLTAYLAASWNIIGGVGGQLSIGHAAFFGLGGYTSTILFKNFGLSPWVGIWIGVIIACLVGALIGFLCFRYKVKEIYFALVTLAFCEVLRIIFLNTKSLGSSLGLLVPFKGHLWSAFQFETKMPYYYIILVMTVALFVLVQFYQSFRFVSYLMAIREDEDAAQALGIDVFKMKFLGFLISAGLTALGGTFYAQYTLFVDPPSMFGMMRSVDPIIICILGGMGTVWGPLLGSAVFTSFMEICNIIFHGGYGSSHLVLYGILLMAAILIFPQGLESLFSRSHK
jgi:branched-chain amino acid transport system permease protein